MEENTRRKAHNAMASLLFMANDVQVATAEDDALHALAMLRHLRRYADDVERQLVAGARESRKSWTQIGESLAVSKQAAQKKYAGSLAGQRLSCDWGHGGGTPCGHLAVERDSYMAGTSTVVTLRCALHVLSGDFVTREVL